MTTPIFRNAADLENHVFRITDNGGETHDRITVTFTTGDAIVCTETTICAHVEGSDVRRDSEDVEAGTARDLRWIDLNPTLQSRIIADLNAGYADWFETFTPPADRAAAADFASATRLDEWAGVGVYGVAGAYRIKNDWAGVAADESDYGPYETLADAVRGSLPEPGFIAGEEYQSTRDLWSEEGGPAPLWDREAEPPVIDEDNAKARVVIKLERPDIKPGELLETVAWFANLTDAENYLTPDNVDPDLLEAGAYTIDDLDDPDAAEG